MLWSQGWLRAAGTYPGFCSMKRLEVFLLPLERTLGHRRSLPHNFARLHQKLADTHLYTWAERGTVQEHKTMSPARARTRTTRSGVERTNHGDTAPPTLKIESILNLLLTMVVTQVSVERHRLWQRVALPVLTISCTSVST